MSRVTVFINEKVLENVLNCHGKYFFLRYVRGKNPGFPWREFLCSPEDKAKHKP
jgi:hypothetical protein